MQLTTIDDLLDLAGRGGDEAAGLSSAVEMLQFAAPTLVLLARADGAVVFADDFASGAAPELVANLACDLARRLKQSDSGTVAFEPPLDGRVRLALRLPGTPTRSTEAGTRSREADDGGFLACLIESSPLRAGRLGSATTAALVASALASAVVRHKARAAELSARIEQLTAGQDALRATYAQSLAETIEEHELRLREQEAAQGQLVQAQKLESIGQLAAGIAHEINTPTQFIGDNLRFLQDAFAELMLPLAASRGADCGGQDAGSGGQGDSASPFPCPEDVEYLVEEIPKAIAQSLEGVERVANIVRAMKEFSHPGTDEMQPVDLNKALECTLTVCRNEWKYVADAAMDFDPHLPPVHCLPGECNQVFLNLIINAAHAIADKQGAGPTQKGTITVSTRADGDWIEVRVSDTGTGIAEEHRSKVFDPFFTTKEVGRGTGQGLAIARSVIVGKHGGGLSFDTETGRGTTFIVRLPRPGPRVTQGTGCPGAPPGAPAGGFLSERFNVMKRILFVDDEARILDGLRRSLRGVRGEWEMVFAEGGVAALRECAAQSFDVVVSDARMPGMEGAELLGDVRELYPDAARIILSGQCSRNSVLRCVGVAHQFLSKPCEPATLRSAVQKVCAVRDVFPPGPKREAISCAQWLPSQPAIRRELAEQVASPAASIERVAEIVARDLGMSAKVVQLVSSGFFGSPQRVSAAGHAARLLGMETLKAMSASAAAFRPCFEAAREEDLRLLIAHSLAVAEAAEEIAETLTGDRALVGDARLAGLLHEIGRLALTGCDDAACRERGAGSHPEGARPGVRISAPCFLLPACRNEENPRPAPTSGYPPGTPGPTPQLREDPDLGGYLAALWGLPDPVVQAIAYHRAPGSCPDSPLAPLTAVHVAHALCERCSDATDEALQLDRAYLRSNGCLDRVDDWREKARERPAEGAPQ